MKIYTKVYKSILTTSFLQNSEAAKKNQSGIEDSVASIIINLSMKYEAGKCRCDFSANKQFVRC
jgi:hypothetical protein